MNFSLGASELVQKKHCFNTCTWVGNQPSSIMNSKRCDALMPAQAALEPRPIQKALYLLH